MTKLLWTATFLCHRAHGDVAVGTETLIRFNATFEEMHNMITQINSKHEINVVHIVQAKADDKNFISPAISEIWDANLDLRDQQAIKTHQAWIDDGRYPDIYNAESLARLKATLAEKREETA